MVLVSLKKFTGTATEEEEALISLPTFLLLPEVVLLFLTSFLKLLRSSHSFLGMAVQRSLSCPT